MKSYFKWLWPLLLLAFIPYTPAIDLAVERFFYTSAPTGGHFVDNFLTTFFFRYGELIGFFTGSVALTIFIWSFFWRKLKRYRKGALHLVLTLVIGAGLVTNAILKEHWGRPRPKQITEFGGPLEYRPFWKPNFDSQREPQKSFPSGHVAMGFYYLSFCLVARRYNSLILYRIGLLFTLLFGLGEAFSRLAQGGHFFSDALFAFLLMWVISHAIDWFLFTRSEK